MGEIQQVKTGELITPYNTATILNIVNNSSEAIIALDLDGNVTFCNRSAELLLGYNSIEILGEKLPIITTHSEFELEYILEKSKEWKPTTFRTQKTTKNGIVLDLIISTSPLTENSEVKGIALFIREYSTVKNVCYIPLGTESILREQKRTFNVLRDLIISTIGEDKKTINQIASDSGINWKTVEKHLTHLIGKKLAQEIFSSEYVRIFELTSLGKEYIIHQQKEQEKIFITRE